MTYNYAPIEARLRVVRNRYPLWLLKKLKQIGSTPGSLPYPVYSILGRFIPGDLAEWIMWECSSESILWNIADHYKVKL